MHQIDHTNTIIELTNVSFSYGEDRVVENITLAIHKGDYLGIIGPNGGGKSTLLKLILGLLTPTSGTISLYGKPIKHFKDWLKIGYVSQHVTHIDPNFPMTVEEVVNMGRYPKVGMFRMLSPKDKDIAKESMKQVSMYEYKDRLIGDLSGGQQQRVFIARALAGQPEIIVLDEPTVGVDVKTQQQFYTLLQELNTQLGLTLVLVSHELDIVAHESTEIAYINKSLVYHGTPKQFMASDYVEKLSGKGTHSDA